MKTTFKSIFALTLIALISFTAPSVFAGNNEVYNLEAQAFKAEVSLPSKNKMELKFQNAEAPVQVMLLSMEDGIVLVKSIKEETEITEIDLDKLEDGEYTLQMEYQGQIMTRDIVLTSPAMLYDDAAQAVRVNTSSEVTLISQKDGIVLFESLESGAELSFSNVAKGEYILLIESEGQTFEQNITL